MRRLVPLLLIAVTACSADPDARATADEGRLTAKAVADVDAALADTAKPGRMPAAAAAPVRP